MSKRDIALKIVLPSIALIVGGIQAWDVLERRHLVSGVLAFLVCLTLAVYLGWAIAKNIKDACRAAVWETRYLNEKYDHTTDRNHLVIQLASKQEEINELIARKAREMEDLQARNNSYLEKAMKDARQVVVLFASWGFGGNYSRDVTDHVRHMVSRMEGDWTPQDLVRDSDSNDTKVLLVEFMCPYSGIKRQRQFKINEAVNFERTCREALSSEGEER